MIEQKSLEILKSAVEVVRMTAKKSESDGERIKASALFPEWKSGKYEVGDIYTASGQVWECFQPYDNAVYPDITPENSAWYTFNRPLHGDSVDTAREFVKVTGAHDMYRKGEYTIFNGEVYECIIDTNYSPKEYSQAWAVVE